MSARPRRQASAEAKEPVRMHDRQQLITFLAQHGAEEPRSRGDYPNSISSEVVRCRLHGRRTAAVSASSTSSVCIGAVLDVLDMHEAEDSTYAGLPVAVDEVGLVLTERPDTEAMDAIGSLLAAKRDGPTVHVHVLRADGTLEPVTPPPVDFVEDPHADKYAGYVKRVEAGPNSLLRYICDQVGRDELRAYPQMTQVGVWSLRLEGLEVGRFRGRTATLSVGKSGKYGGVSFERKVWLEAAPPEPVAIDAGDQDGVDQAVRLLRAFAARWLDRPPSEGGKTEQDELALESRVLRGACPVKVSTGRLHVLKQDPVVNWGSQFITRWGHTKSNVARRLDALLRNGSTPWAVEMKIEGGTGIGSYYRHAVAQAVLYRHYVRTTPQLESWFADHGLDRSACRAAVVIPKLGGSPHEQNWRARHQRICDFFDVELVEVERRYAYLC